VLRYGLLGLNVALLAGVISFVALSSPTNTVTRSSAVSAASTDSRDPLDQLSSAGIAANLAQMTNLPEISGVMSQAYSADTELAGAPAQTAAIAQKPQDVATVLKSQKDITTYITKNGDTIASVAAQFGVTSDSILWSNNLTGNAVGVGIKLVIPPVTGIVYTVQANDTPDSLAQKYRANKDQIIAYNDAEITGLHVGEQIIIPNGQQVVTQTAATSYGYGGVGSFAAVYGSYNGYDFGFCTWWVAKHRADLGNPVPTNLGNASTWDDRAFAAGLPVDKVPAVGAAVVTSKSGAGHVAFVEAVNADGSVWVSEMNSHGQRSMTDPTPAGGWDQIDYKLIPASTARTYNYIH